MRIPLMSSSAGARRPRVGSVFRILRVPRVVLVGSGFAVLSAALYLYLAVYWAVVTVTEDPGHPKGDIAFGGGPGTFRVTITSLGCCASLAAAWGGLRLWGNDRAMAVCVLVVGAVIGVWPASVLLGPEYA